MAGRVGGGYRYDLISNDKPWRYTAQVRCVVPKNSWVSMKKFCLTLLFSLMASGVFAELPPESIPNVKKLPSEYPDSWIFAHDANFNSLIAGKVILVDIAADTKEYKGAVDASQFPNFIASTRRSEMYVGETFYSRGTSGVRTDVLSIYDMATMDKLGEVLLPNNNRALIVANRYAIQLLDDDRFLVIFNFSPATSATVIDIKNRVIVTDISLPGCSMIYPTGKRGFSSLCSDGSFFTVQLNRKGEEANRIAGKPFFSVEDDPVFDKPSYIGTTAYFVSYKALVYPVDMSGRKPKVLDSWSLVNKEEARRNWRPSGWQISTTDGDEELYVIMAENSYDGSHKNGGEQIWVANVDDEKIDRRFSVAETNAFSLELASGDNPLLAVTNANMLLDVYDTEGRLQRSLNLGDAATPFTLHSKR